MHRNQTIALSFAALALASTSAQSQGRRHTSAKSARTAVPQWHDIYTDSKVTVAIDPHGTIKHGDGTYTSHLRWTYKADQPIGRDKSYRVMREIRLLNCQSLSTKIVTAYTLDAAGKSVSSFDTPQKDIQYLAWEKRAPGTTSANALAGVCQSLKGS